MHPDYKQHMEGKRGGEAFRFRATDEERAQLEQIAATEGGTLTDLIVEGLWRVIDNRANDPQYQAAKDEAVRLQADLDEVRSNLHSM